MYVCKYVCVYLKVYVCARYCTSGRHVCIVYVHVCMYVHVNMIHLQRQTKIIANCMRICVYACIMYVTLHNREGWSWSRKQNAAAQAGVCKHKNIPKRYLNKHIEGVGTVCTRVWNLSVLYMWVGIHVHMVCVYICTYTYVCVYIHIYIHNIHRCTYSNLLTFKMCMKKR